MYSNNRTRRKWNQVLLFLVSCHFVKYSISSPIFSSQFSQFQSARNLRNLPCIVKRSGLEGVCMFAIDCIKSNGTHLGTCIDKFYFGSCCQMKLQDVDSIYNPEISDNSIDSSSDSKPFIPVSSSTSTSISFSTSVLQSRTTPMPTLNYNNKTFELIPTTSSSSKSPAETSTEKYKVSVGGFSTTLGTILEKNFTTTISLPTSTENSRISTFQTILNDSDDGEKRSTTTRKPPSTTHSRTRKPPAKPTTSQPSKKPVSQLQSLNRTSVSSESTSTTPSTTTKTSSSTVKLTKRPITTSTTVKPSKNATSTVIKTTRKPVASTNVTVNRKTTISSRRNSTFTTTRRPIITTTKISTTQHSSTDASSSTSSSKDTTNPPTTSSKAPRPRPTPAEHIVKVDSTTLSAENIITRESTTEKSSTTSQPTSSSTIKSTVVTRKTTKRPQATLSSTNKPVTETSTIINSSQAATVRDEASSSTSTTTRKPLDENKVLISTTSEPELITWTLGNVEINNSTNKGDAWVLVPSLTPSDVKPLTPPTSEVELKITEMPPRLNLTQLFDNITIVEETSSSEEEEKEKVRETTMSAIPIEEQELEEEENEEEEEEEEVITSSEEESSIEDVKNPSSDNGESEIATTEFTDIDITTTKPINVVNLTLSTITSSSSPQIDETITLTTTTTTRTSELSPDESLPAIDPDETTMWSVTQRNNDTFTTENYESSVNSSSSESDSLGMNETSTSRYPSSTAASLEGVDYKQICGRRMFPEARIVGGAKASFGRWPWQISLRQWRTSTYLHKCGSALLNENWAISAAHCVDNVPPSDLLLRLGEFDLSIEEEPYGYQERRVQIVASHPQFDPRTFEYDLALLRFYEPVVFQPNIIPVCVPETDEDFIGRTAYVTGWGRLYEDGPLPSTLQEVTVPVIRNDICEAMYRNAGYIEHIPHIFICAGHKLGAKDSCEGDSGGPMVIQREDKRFQLAGIISWGIGCAEPNQPGVYTRISEFRDWINQILMF